MTYFTVNGDIPSIRSSSQISTLGPSGTSSEHAARYFLKSFGTKSFGTDNCRILLYPSYRDAARSVSVGESEYLVVANAFHGINDFYMDPVLSVHSVFRT